MGKLEMSYKAMSSHFIIREGAYEDYGYRQRIIVLEQQNAWELIAMENTAYLKNERISCKMCTCRVS